MSYTLKIFIDTLLKEDKRVVSKIDSLLESLSKFYSKFPLVLEYLERLRVTFYLKELSKKSIYRYKSYLSKYYSITKARV